MICWNSIIFGLCMFIALLNFKPSEPYLSQFLICNESTQSEECSKYLEANCLASSTCIWNGVDSSCGVIACANVSTNDCGNSMFNFCKEDDGICVDSKCYESFSESVVNNEIYPWSTYAYLPFLLLLGPFAELYSYRLAIFFGIFGRVVTRALLVFGKTLPEMQVMEVAYSLGTAGEDVFSAYIYYVVPRRDYQFATSSIKAAALISCVVSGVLGDILVVLYNVPLPVLMWISAAFVWIGFLLGLRVIQTPILKPLLLLPSNYSKEETRNPKTPTSLNIRYKIQIFKRQIRCLCEALRSTSVLSMMVMWILCNAVFQTLYNYEVSIFQELQGNDSSWNGSVLGVMLIAGSIGAMIPAMHTDPLTSFLQLLLCRQTREGDQQRGLLLASTEGSIDSARHNDVTISSRIMIALCLSVASLCGFVQSWKIVVSISCLAIFFATWQYINVVVFSRFAESLQRTGDRLHCVLGEASLNGNVKIVRGTSNDEAGEEDKVDDGRLLDDMCNDGSVCETEPPFSISIVLVIALNVAVQIVLQSILFSSLQLSLRSACTYLVWVFISSSIVFIVSCMFLFGVSVYMKSWISWWASL